MSKKSRQTTVNNIQNLNLEIDYDRLADSIIKTEHRAKEAQVIKEKNSFKRKVWHIIINKKGPKKAYTAYLMANILSAILNMCAIFCIVFFAFFL